jgi:shikimate kinase
MILKLKQTPGIYVVGFMGAGKSTVGKLLAEQIGWPFVDIDDDIEAQNQSSISEIFELFGETAFREMESEAIRARVDAVKRGLPLVMAVGGGAFAQPQNYDLLENHGVTIWLDCPLELIRRRIGQQTHRPLARDPKRFEELYRARRQAYARADYTVPIYNDNPDVAVQEIMLLPLFR